jgi:DNA-directed RNA polymerase subunit K/omega
MSKLEKSLIEEDLEEDETLETQDGEDEEDEDEEQDEGEDGEDGEDIETEDMELELEDAVDEEVPQMAANDGELIDLIDLIIDQSDGNRKYYTDIRVDRDNMYNTYPYLTKYEMARIAGVRAEQLGRNAPTLLEERLIIGKTDHEIACMEISSGHCPWMIARPLPNGTRLLININLLKR